MEGTHIEIRCRLSLVRLCPNIHFAEAILGRGGVIRIIDLLDLNKGEHRCWADLKIKFDHEAPLNYSEFNYCKISKSQNIDFDGELSVEANAI